MAKFKTVIFDISGVIVDARLEFCRKIGVSMEYAGLHEYDFSFEELLVAFGRDAFDDKFKEKIREEKLRNQKMNDFYTTWGKIPEFYPGNVKLFENVIPTLTTLMKQGFKVVFASRLAFEFREILKEELRRKGIEEVEKYLFSIGPEYEQYLKNGTVDKEIVRTFNRKNYSLSNEAKIYEISENAWGIADDAINTYRIKKKYTYKFDKKLGKLGTKLDELDIYIEGIEMYGPTIGERYLPNCMDFVFRRVIDGTEPPRVYIDDGISRMAYLKRDKFDPNVYCIGSTCGFFNDTLLKEHGADEPIHDLSEIIRIVRW